MADDQNNSNGNPMNKSGVRQIGEDLAREIKLRAIEEQNVRRRIYQNQAIMQLPPELVDNLPSIPNQGKAAIQLQKDRAGLQTRVGSDLERRNQQFSTAVERNFSMSSVNGVAMQERFSPQVAAQSASMSGMSWDQMQERRGQLEGEVSTIQREAKGLVRGAPNQGQKGIFTSKTISDPNNLGRSDVYEKLDQYEARKKDIGISLAAISTQERERKAQGSDPRSREDRTFQYRAEASKEALLSDARERGSISTTNGRTGQKEEIQLQDVAKELHKTFQDLVSDTKLLSKASKEEAEVLHKRIQGHTDKIDDLKSVNDDRKDKMDNARNIASGLSGGFNAVGSAYQQIMVGQRMGQTSNIAGYASIENQKYEQYKNARGGDIKSAMMLTQWGQSKEFGQEMFNHTQAANGLFVAGGVAQTAAGGIGVASTLNLLENTTSTSAVQAARVNSVLNVTQGLATTAVAGADTLRKVSAGSADIQGQNLNQSASGELMHVTAGQVQQYRDLAVGSGQVGMGMGARGEGFMKEVTGEGFTKKLIGARMSGEQFNQMSQQGSDAMGSMFNTNQVFAARGLERSGMGGMQQNLQRMATLAQVGSNNPKENLGSVLELAVAKGLDTSKSLDLMVQNTAAMVQQNATATAAGVDVSGASAGLLGAGMDQSAANKEFALNRSKTAKDFAQDIMSNTDVSFAGMVNTSRIARTTGLSSENAIYAAKLSTEQWQTMKKELDTASPNEKSNVENKIKRQLANQGVDTVGMKGSLGNMVNTMLDNSVTTLTEGGGVGIQTASVGQRKKIADAMKSGDLSGLNDSDIAVKNVGEMNKPAGDSSSSAKLLAGEGGSDILKTLDNLRTSGFKQLAEQADAAHITLGKVGGALKNIVDMNDKLEALGAGDGEANFGKAAADAAASFGTYTGKFGDHVAAFGGIMGAMAKKAGLNYDPAAAEVKKTLDKVDKSLDAKPGTN